MSDMPSPPPRDRFGEVNVKLTYDDFLLFPDDGQRHELIDGEHYVTPSPNIRHQEISGRLYLLIGTWLNSRRLGKIFYAPLDVRFSMFDVVEPDLLYVSNERAADLLTGQCVMGSPDLVVEIGSPSTRQRDETIKRRLYRSRPSQNTGSSTRTSTSFASTAVTATTSLDPSNCHAKLATCSPLLSFLTSTFRSRTCSATDVNVIPHIGSALGIDFSHSNTARALHHGHSAGDPARYTRRRSAEHASGTPSVQSWDKDTSALSESCVTPARFRRRHRAGDECILRGVSPLFDASAIAHESNVIE